MLEFPTPVALKARYEALKGIKLDVEASKALFMPYKGGEVARWYFQDAAIRATLEKLVWGGKSFFPLRLAQARLFSLPSCSGKSPRLVS